MSKVLYGAAMSLDGFIAGPGGDMRWMNQHPGPNPITGELIAAIGALLIGKRTFTGDDPNRGTEKEGPFGGAWSGPQFVLTHQAPDTPVPGITFVDDLDSGVAAAKAAAGDRYVSIFGADVARQCFEAGLIDEVVAVIVPVLLGDGVRLLDRPGGTKVRLELMRQSEAPNATNLWYRVVK